jgi:hypothetical protein
VTDISIVWICVRRPLAAMMGSLVTVAAVMARLTAHPGLLRALPGYLLPPHLSGSLMSSKLVLGTRAESSHHLMSSL